MADTIFLGGTAANELLTGSAGSDVIYGQGGIDRLIGGDGNDSLNSGEYLVGNNTVPDLLGDWLDGGNGDDQLIGGSGSDFLYGGTGTNSLNGGGGFDTAMYSGVRADFTVGMNATTGMPTGVRPVSGSGVIDTLVSVERLSFWDGAIAFDIDGNAGAMYRLYQAAFNRTPDKEGLGWWIKAADDGAAWTGVAKGFMGSPEWTKLYGANSSNADFLTNLYKNALHRDPDAEGFAFWLDVLDNKGGTREQTLVDFAKSPENQAAVIGQIQNGIEYTLFTG